MIKISNFKCQISNNKHSFTLVEILVAVSIFTILMIMGITSYGTIINWKKRDTSTNELQAAARHAMEVMTQAIEGTDLNKASIPIEGVTYFGFRLNGEELTVYSDTNIVFTKTGAAITKDGSNLTPSSVNVTALDFSGYGKRSDNYDTSGYQQPYVTIAMTLESAQPDPETGVNKSADFKTTVKPQPTELMGYAEVQAGSDSVTTSWGNEASFNIPFSKPPVVIIARSLMNEDDDDTFVDDIYPDRFIYGDSTSGGITYWIAVSGNFPNFIKSGEVNAKDSSNYCGNANALCVPYVTPFPSAPISFVTRTYPTNDEQYMNYVVRDSQAPSQLKIAGNSWDGTGSKSSASDTNMLWISFNSQIKQILSSQGIIFNLGNQLTKDNYNGDGNFDCPSCTYETGVPPFVQTLTTYMCGFRNPGLPPTSLPGSKVTFSTPFTTLSPKTVISAASNGIILNYNTVGDHNINTPGVSDVQLTKFYYTNFGGGVTDITTCNSFFGPLFYTGPQQDYVTTNYSINWVAMNQDFKLTWSYQ